MAQPLPDRSSRGTVATASHEIAPAYVRASAAFQSDLAFSERSAGTLSKYRHELARFGRWLVAEHLDYDTITRAQIKGYLQARMPLGVSARRNLITYLRSFYTWCVDEHQRTDSPMAGITMPKLAKPVPKALNRAQTRALIAHVTAHRDDGPRQHRDYAVVMMGLYAGLRAEEIAERVWNDVTPDGIVIRLSKWNRGRTIHLHPVLEQVLIDWRAVQTHAGDTDPIFSLNGVPIVPNRVGAIARRYARQLGLPLTAHTLRHTFATRAIRESGDLYSVSKALGHAHLSHTEPYLRASPDDSRAAVVSLPDQW